MRSNAGQRIRAAIMRLAAPAALLCCALLIVSTPPVSAASVTVSVPGSANIFGAGHAIPPAPGGGGGGVLPTLVTLPPGTGRTITFTGVTGTIDFGPCCPENGPDGVPVADAIPAPIWDGLAGTDFPVRSRFLVGVFVDATEPADPAPGRLTFVDGAFATLAPGLRQVFFVGDGRTGTGTGDVQVFEVPDDAARLYLGVQDRFSSDPNVPGYYGDNSGLVTLTVDVAGVVTAVDGRPAPVARPILWQNAPNPFNPTTTIRWELPAGGSHVALDVYDVRGRHVRSLLAEHRPGGTHAVRWDGTADDGTRLAAGSYICRLTTRSGVESVRMVLVP
jgi:hypothetical protein